jgi:hypothetical protein
MLGILCAGMLAVSTAHAQPSPSTKTVVAVNAPRPAAAGTSMQSRQLAVLRVHSFAQNIFGFKSRTSKPLPLAQLADLLWKDDEPYARQLFGAAIDLSSTSSERESQEAKLMVELRRSVISLIARHDAEWAKRLISTEDSSQAAERMEDNFSVAYDSLAKEPAKAVTFAELSLRDGVFPYMSSLLLKLRARNEPAANALFLQSLERLVAMPAVDANELLHLGTYVFTSPRLNPQDRAISPEAVVQIGVGHSLVYDISADRPGIPPEIVRAYLFAAHSILANARFADAQQQETSYVACYLLLPKAEKFAPEVFGPIAAVMADLGGHMPAELSDRSAFAKLETKSKKSLDEMLSDIEKLPSDMSRNQKYLFLAFSLWSKGDFVKAGEVAERISDLDVRSKLGTLNDFGKAATLLERGPLHLSEAEDIADKLPKDIERAVLWLGIAAAHIKAGNKQRAMESANEGLVASRNVSDGRQLMLILGGAGKLAAVEPTLALAALAEAVRGYNAGGKSDATLHQEVSVGKVKLYFPLKANGVGCGLSETLRALAVTDFDGTLATVNSLKAEDKKSEAFVVMASIMLR